MLGELQTFKILNASRIYHKAEPNRGAKLQTYMHVIPAAAGVFPAASSLQSSYLCTDLTPCPTHRQVPFNQSSTGLHKKKKKMHTLLKLPRPCPWGTGNCKSDRQFVFLIFIIKEETNKPETEKFMHSLLDFWPLPWLNWANLTLLMVALGNRRGLRQLQI